MQLQKTFFSLSFTLLLMTSPLQAMAGDFDWLKELNITATNDLSGFKARLATRFQIGDAQINTVISNVAQPADAYMVLRMGEMSGRPTDEIIKTYQASKDKGWGVMAKNMGIKPGSKEFHALKQGSDLKNSDSNDNKASNKNKSHVNNKGNGKDKAKS